MGEEKKKESVFYSWQSDIARKDNRNFIEAALKTAIHALNKSGSVVDELILDRDTKNVSGSPVIAETILGKIDRAAVFVGDVTLIGHADSGKPITNPNVMIELGYALKALSHDALVLVLNTAYGNIQDLPFDLRHRRVMTYHLPQATADGDEAGKAARKAVARELERDLENALREILNSRLVQPVEPVLSPVEQLEQYLLDPNDARRATRLIDSEIDNLSKTLDGISNSEIAKDESPEGVYHLMQTYEKLTEDVMALYIRGCHDDDSVLTQSLVKGLTRLAHVAPIPHRSGHLHFYPALLLLYTGGIAALSGDRYMTLVALMRQVRIRTSTYPKGSPAAFQLVPYRVIDERTAKNLPPVYAHHTPLSDYFFKILRDPLRRVIKIDLVYEECFFLFEYLFALASAFANDEYGISGIAAPVGSYVWERNLMRPPYIFEVTDKELNRQKDSWPPFKAGIFDGTFDEFLLYKKQADESIKRLIGRYYPSVNV